MGKDLQTIYMIMAQYTKYTKNLYLNIEKSNDAIKNGREKKNGRGSKQTFFQRRHLDVQQAYEKILNSTNCQGNANQYHNKLLPHTCQNGYYQKGNKQPVLARI